MSVVPSERPEPSVSQVAAHRPVEIADAPSRWRKVWNLLRRAVGRKPIELIDRLAEAKVAREEVITENGRIDGQVRLMEAQADFAYKMAQIRKMDAEADGQRLKNLADWAELTRNREVIEKLANARNTTTKEQPSGSKQLFR